MAPIMKTQQRKSAIRPSFFRPRTEVLEERTLPGEAILGGLLTAWWLEPHLSFLEPDSLPAASGRDDMMATTPDDIALLATDRAGTWQLSSTATADVASSFLNDGGATEAIPACSSLTVAAALAPANDDVGSALGNTLATHSGLASGGLEVSALEEAISAMSGQFPSVQNSQASAAGMMASPTTSAGSASSGTGAADVMAGSASSGSPSSPT
jgi:hypothetical protein